MRDNQERRKDLRRDAARDRRPLEREDAENILEGRNALTEALASGRAIDKVFIAEGSVVETDRRKLDQMSATGAHQGVIAMVAAHSYATLDDILNRAKERGEAPLIVICDELSDPHNLGAIIRTAECAGAHGVVIPKRRSVGLTAIVGKALARVTNITNAIKELKERGVWIFGTAAEGATPLYQADLKGAAAIVIGNEGDGMSRLVAESCDLKVSIPMKGRISSLNASAAAAILLYEAVRQRG